MALQYPNRADSRRVSHFRPAYDQLKPTRSIHFAVLRARPQPGIHGRALAIHSETSPQPMHGDLYEYLGSR